MCKVLYTKIRILHGNLHWMAVPQASLVEYGVFIHCSALLLIELLSTCL